ncbi:luciferase domain-containing protein [Luethyella okanaganae]|uniref:Luciferase family protein n=1 Tax=Luethyella okanaganae TaxID=69372 RepID=A0ABW1VFA6_9MICO
MIALEGVREGKSGVSAPSSLALYLRRDLATGPSNAFFVGTEFAHLHGDGSGSLHLSLPLNLVEEVFTAGWGEQHPVVKLGGPPNWVMLFGPRDRAELDVVWGLVHASYVFARGDGSAAR